VPNKKVAIGINLISAIPVTSDRGLQIKRLNMMNINKYKVFLLVLFIKVTDNYGFAYNRVLKDYK